jgi:glycosyltransferase involved in cell wall biosynthesis
MSHVALVIPGLDRIGGAERQVLLLAEGLRRRSWRVTVIALSGTGGAAADELRDAGVEFFSLAMRRGLMDPRGWMRFHGWLRRERPDVVHSHLAHASLLARVSRLAAPIPVLIDTVHSSGTGRLRRRLLYACSRWLPDHVTAVSQAAAGAHLAKGMVRGENLSILANGIDLNAWQPDPQARAEARQALGAGDAFVWIAVGRLDAVKDYPSLLHAMTRIPAPARLVILGTGPLGPQLKRMTEDLALQNRVDYPGFDPHVERWMQAADAFVLSSRYEGLPMVMLEAEACELPAVATDVPGTREVVMPGENGWLARPSDPEDLARAMMKMMLLSAGQRRAMGRQARRLVAGRFDLESVLDQWEQLYTGLSGRSDGRCRISLSVRETLNRQSAISSRIRSGTDSAAG